MELGGGGGESAAKRARRSGDADPAAAAAAGEDRISELPDDILVLILRRLSTRGAGQTSVLSRRWRRVWALLPALHFRHARDPRQIGAALEAHDPEAALLRLCVWTRDAAPESISAWLPVAARRLSGVLLLNNTVSRERGAQQEEEEEAARRGAFELPCLDRATEVGLDLGFLGLAVPPAGVFARLTGLHLSSVRFHGPGLLGDAVSWPRCPCLQKLTVHDTRGLDNLAVRSNSLREVELTHLRGLQQLGIVAPVLKELKVSRCFLDDRSQPVATITAPQLTTLTWMDLYDPSSVRLNEMQHLRFLRPLFFLVYGDDRCSTHNQSCLSLLQRFTSVEGLILKLAYLWNTDYCHYLMEDMTMLPHTISLHLNVVANGHAFGASAFHVLRMCSGIRRLMLTLLDPTVVEAQTTCSPGCICGEHETWKTEHLLLNCLQEVEITQLRGSEHEVAFVKQLFIWGTALARMKITLDASVSENVAKELCQVLGSFSRPAIHMEIQTHEGMVRAVCED